MSTAIKESMIFEKEKKSQRQKIRQRKNFKTCYKQFKRTKLGFFFLILIGPS